MNTLIKLGKPSTRAFTVLAILSATLLLSGCSPTDQPIDENTSGYFNHYFVYSFSRLITFIADAFGGNYGLSIILVTIMIRLLLLPLMMKQYRNQSEMRMKMKKLQPEMTALKDKYKQLKDSESQKKFQQEMMVLYQRHQVNPLNIGCLPMLIQLPFLYAFYYAIRRTPEIAAHSFLWFDLGHTDAALPLIAAATYFLQTKIAMRGAGPDVAGQMAAVAYLSPILMGLFSFTAPAALPLYWTVGGLFVIFQTLLARRLYPQPKEN